MDILLKFLLACTILGVTMAFMVREDLPFKREDDTDSASDNARAVTVPSCIQDNQICGRRYTDLNIRYDLPGCCGDLIDCFCPRENNDCKCVLFKWF